MFNNYSEKLKNKIVHIVTKRKRHSEDVHVRKKKHTKT